VKFKMKRVLCLTILILILLGNVAFSATAANTAIVNVAEATYRDSSGFRYSVLSNVVEVIVRPVYGIQITPDHQERRVISGDFVEFPFYLENRGNVADKFYLSFVNLPGDDGDFNDLNLFIDVNRNGRVEPGEPAYSNEEPPELAPGEVLSLILKGRISSGLSGGEVRASLSGFSLSDPQKRDENNVAVAQVESAGFVRVFKAASRAQVIPGDEVVFSLEFSNPGTRAVETTTVSVDFNNDGIPEARRAILIADPLPFSLEFQEVLSFEPQTDGVLVFKGSDDSYWKRSSEEVSGDVREVGLLLPSLLPDQQGYLQFKIKVKQEVPPQTVENTAYSSFGEGDSFSNSVFLKVLPFVKVVADDVDDGGGYSGSGEPTDPDDLTVIDSAASGRWLEFRNEVWNLGNTVDVINLSLDRTHSINLPEGALVYFFSPNGTPLVDTNGDGLTDVGSVNPGERVEFITKVYIPSGSYRNVVFAVRGSSSLDFQVYDLTYDKVVEVESVAIQVLTRVQSITQNRAEEITLEAVPLGKKKVVAYEYSSSGELVRKKFFWTDSNGFIVYDENGQTFPLFDWMRENYIYRITVAQEVNGFTYFLTPPFRKDYFRAVSSPGEEKCWTFDGKEVDCSYPQVAIRVEVKEDGTKLLTTPLDPAGYVYDGITGEKINGACVYFYRCLDEACSAFDLVRRERLDLYPDGATLQENPQLSGPTDGLGQNVGKGEGAFTFLISNFQPQDAGWYFIKVDYDCSLPAADASLKEKYFPVEPNFNAVWSPYSGEPYRGEKFYLDYGFPGAILFRIPLLPSSFKPLRVIKSVSSTSASIGDFVRWSIRVENPNKDFTVYDVKVRDVLPRGLRYKGGTSRLDGTRFDDPEIKRGRELSWSIGDLPPGKSVEITFYTVLTPGITEGKVKNVAGAQGWSSKEHWVPIGSNEAFAYLKVSKGVFTDRGYIIGRVFIDENANGLFDRGEVGVKGAKVYLEDGRFAVTGSEGKFHFDDVRPGTHVVKLDLTTVPANVELEVSSNRNAGDPGTAFADLYPGDVFKVNFPLVPAKIRAKARGIFTPLKGKVSFERVIEGVLSDPSTGKVVVRNSLTLKNDSPYPLYELVYRESSPYTPKEGSSYLNGSPFEDPLFEGGTFSWRVPLLPPKERVVLSWFSPLPSGSGEAKGELSFSLKPVEGHSLEVPVKVPVVFEAVEPDVYRLTVYFDFGSYSLTPEARASLEKIADFLRKKNYKTLFVRVVGHTDSVRVRRGTRDYKDNRELSLKRAQAVKAYLEELFIDLKKVKVEAE